MNVINFKCSEFSKLLGEIKYIRSQSKISQMEMSEKLGVSFRTYQRMESGQSEFSIQQFLQLLNFLRPHSNDLFRNFFIKVYGHSSEKLQDIQLVELNTIKRKPLTKRSDFEIEMIKEFYSRFGKNKDRNHLIGYWEWNLKLKEVYWCNEMYEIHETPIGDKILLSDIQKNLSLGEWEILEAQFKNLLLFYKPFHEINHIKKKDGEKIKVEVQARKFYNRFEEEIIFGVLETIA